MVDRAPAWAKESTAVRLDGSAEHLAVTPRWAWGGATGAGVRVALIDSGVDAAHPALGGCVDDSGGICFEVGPGGEVVPAPGPHGDACGHGTACASIIHQLAPDATITSVRVLGRHNTGKVAAFTAGLAWAIEQRFDVINLSLGTGLRDWALAFHDLCDQAYFANSLVVTAANNRPKASYPSLYASVLSVACNHARDPFRFHANPNPPTEFLARGIDVEVAWRGGGYSTVTGNSFAAPHISAIAALIRSKHPTLRPFQLKSVLWATAVNIRHAGTGTGEPGMGEADIAGRISRNRTQLVSFGGTRATRLVRPD